MFRTPTVFILGAGASWHYGYPTGEELVKKVSETAKGLYSVEEDCNGSQLHPGEEISRKLVITCGDGAEVLEQIEEALDQIAFTVECEVALPLDVSVGLGRNNRSDSTLGESFHERIGVISFVGNQGLWVGVLDQRFRASKIMILAWCKHQFDGIAHSVDERMNLGRQSAARSADRLRAVFFRAPALCWCARTIEAAFIVFLLWARL